MNKCFDAVEISHLKLPVEYVVELDRAAWKSAYTRHDLLRMATEGFLLEHGLIEHPLLYPQGYSATENRKAMFKREEA